MGYLKKNRRCNICDERDSAGYAQDPTVFNPLCCHTCANGGKPACCYIAHFGCSLVCSGKILVGHATTNFALPCDAPDGYDVFLRPFCEFRDTCTYVSIQSAICMPMDMAHDDYPSAGNQFACLPNANALLGCSWQDRGFHQFNAMPPDAVGWTLDLNDSRAVTLSYRIDSQVTVVYQSSPDVRWDCYGPNTMQLVTTNIPGICDLPMFVCVTPQPRNDKDACTAGNAAGHQRAVYDTEDNRCACCDNWCECVLGTISFACSGGGLQTCQANYCTGGRTGVESPAGPSRQAICHFNDSLGVSHEIAVVIYCVAGGDWKADWYCDGHFDGTITLTSTCCPSSGSGPAPPLSCIDCSGCMSFGGGGCTPPPTPPPTPPNDCCGPIPATLHSTLATNPAGGVAYLNGVAVTSTYDGTHWVGHFSAAGNSYTLLLDYMGGCQWKATMSCDPGGAISNGAAIETCSPFTVMPVVPFFDTCTGGSAAVAVITTP